MAENDIDLYADDIDQDFAQDDFGGEGVDLYDDVIATSGTNNAEASESKFDGHNSTNNEDTNGNPPSSAGVVVLHTSSSNTGRRHQLYVGNLTWWTTDQDIANAVQEIGAKDFHEVKFFEHRANGQSKGFCVISLGSEQSMRMCLELLPKKEIHGQNPVVTPPTKQALSNFESPMQSYGGRMPMNSPMRGGPMPPGMQGGPRMQGPPGFNGPPNMNQQPPRFQGQPPQWNGPPRPSGPGMGPMRPGPGVPPPGAQGPPRPPMFQGPPQGQPPRMPNQGPPPGAMRPDWGRPPMQQGFPPQGPPQMGGGGPMAGPPRGPPPMGGPPGAPPQGPPPAPHVNPAFFQQGNGPPPPMQHMQGPGPVLPPQGPPHGPPHGPPMGSAPPPHGAPHYGPPAGLSQPPYGGPPPDHRPDLPPLGEQEFEDIMSRNRTVSSSAIARAVSDAAAGEYASAIETLVTAISLIKQSKVANDDRCKILISSLQDTLRGVEDKSYSSRRDRDRNHRRGRRERSSSRYRDRSRERERERDRDRDRERERDRYYTDSYRDRERERDRSRSRGERVERERERDYRDREAEEARVSRSRNKSPTEAMDGAGDAPPKSRYYEDRYRERERESGRRESDRDRDRDRGRDESHRSRH